MGLKTSIAWCDATYNIWRGCTKVSPGCHNCYAEAQAQINPATLGRWGNHPRVVGAASHREIPLTLAGQARVERVRKRLFVNSLADFWDQWDGALLDHTGEPLYVSQYHQWVTSKTHQVKGLRLLTLDDVREFVFGQMVRTPEIDWLLLTKRPQYIMRTLRRIAESAETLDEKGQNLARSWIAGHPPENVWVGVSVENHSSRVRIHELSEVPAACRFLSVEPILDEVDLSPWLREYAERDRGFGFYQHLPTCSWTPDGGCFGRRTRDCNGDGEPDASDAFHWVIVGGESGDRARPTQLQWIEGVVDQCQESGVPVFVKQLGSDPVETETIKLTLRHKKGEDPKEWPAFFRVQEFPEVDRTED